MMGDMMGGVVGESTGGECDVGVMDMANGVDDVGVSLVSLSRG